MLFAGIYRLTHSIAAMRVVNCTLTLALVAILAAPVIEACPTPLSFFLLLPFVCSQYLFAGGTWLITDNPAWCAVVGALILALRPAFDNRTAIGGGALLFISAAMRQIHVWIGPLFLLAAWIGENDSVSFHEPRKQLRNMAKMAVSLLPAAAMVIWFLHEWHGLVPPSFQRSKTGLRMASAPMTMALIALFGVCYTTVFVPRLSEEWRRNAARCRIYILRGLFVGALIACAPATTFTYRSTDRASGIWRIARYTPVLFGRSTGIAVMALAGGLVCGAVSLTLSARDRWILGGAAFLFIAISVANRSAFQRYNEPFVLILLALAAARSTGAAGFSRTRCALMATGPLTLALIQAGITFLRARPV